MSRPCSGWKCGQTRKPWAMGCERRQKNSQPSTGSACGETILGWEFSSWQRMKDSNYWECIKWCVIWCNLVQKF